MATLTAQAADISCEGCANAIQRALKRLEGVQTVSVDVPAKAVRVEYDEAALNEAVILDRLARAGYESTVKSS